MIKIENLCKTFRTTEVETIALNNVNLELMKKNSSPSWDHPDAENQPY